MLSSKHNSNKFTYPHPILKSFAPVSQHELSYIPPYAYQTTISNDPKCIPHKLLKLSHKEPTVGSNFSMLLHPVYPCLPFETYQQSAHLQCSKCKCYLNSSSMSKISLFKHRCLICGQVQSSEFQNGRYINYDVVDIVKNGQQAKIKDRKIIFAIEANQYLYNKKVVLAIFQSLRALLDTKDNKSMNESTGKTNQDTQNDTSALTGEDYSISNSEISVGFLLFDSNRYYLINMISYQVIVMSCQQFQQKNEFPVVEDELVQPLMNVDLRELEQIVSGLMYEAFVITNSCLIKTMKFCSNIAQQWGIQTRMFAISDDASIQSCKSPNLNIRPEVQLQIFNYSLYEQLNFFSLNKNLSKFHEYRRVDSSILYYRIYHILTQDVFYNAQLEIQHSSMLTCISHSNLSILPILNNNTPLLIEFNVGRDNLGKISSIAAQELLETQCVCIKLTFGQKTRKIVYKIPKINTKIQLEPYLCNDEPYFYSTIHKIFSDSTVPNLRTALLSKCKQIVKKVQNMNDEQFSIPRNLVNFFMYAFMVTDHGLYQKKQPMFQVQRDHFMKEGLQTIVKIIYPKVYEFNPELIALKLKPKSFLHNTVRLVDNGEFLGLVIGDEVKKSYLHNMLNVQDIQSALTWKQIPVLPNLINQKLREAIDQIREINDLYYLPLKIIRFDSVCFEESYGNYLYIEELHKEFFRRLLK